MPKPLATALMWVVALAGVAAPATARDEKAEHEAALLSPVDRLLLAGRFVDILPLADQVIAAAEKRIAQDKRRIYSGQSPEMLMASMADAASAGTDAVDIGPAYGRALFLKGYALVELGRDGEAGAVFDRAVKVSPFNPQFLCESASWHSQHRDFRRGLALFEQCEAQSGLALSNAGDNFRAAAQRGRGYALIELGRLDEAEQIYKARLAEEPGDVKARNELDYIDRQRRRIGRSTS